MIGTLYQPFPSLLPQPSRALIFRELSGEDRNLNLHQ